MQINFIALSDGQCRRLNGFIFQMYEVMLIWCVGITLCSRYQTYIRYRNMKRCCLRLFQAEWIALLLRDTCWNMLQVSNTMNLMGAVHLWLPLAASSSIMYFNFWSSKLLASILGVYRPTVM